MRLTSTLLFPWVSQPSRRILLFRKVDLISQADLDWARTVGNLKFYHRYDDGGHFAAWERPEYLVADMRTFFGPGGGGATGVIATSRR